MWPSHQNGVRLGGEKLNEVVLGRRDLGFILGGTAREDDDVLPLVEILQLTENGRSLVEFKMHIRFFRIAMTRWHFHRFLHSPNSGNLILQHHWYVYGSVNEPHLRNFHRFLYKNEMLQHDRYNDGFVNELHLWNSHSFMHVLKLLGTCLSNTTGTPTVQTMNCTCGQNLGTCHYDAGGASRSTQRQNRHR